LDNINLNEVYDKISDKPTETELVVTNGAGETVATLSDFTEGYSRVNKDITRLCISASYLAEFNRPVFMEYVQNTMGLSRSTAVQMINAGDIYRATEERLLPVSYSKIAELSPVKEQIDNYLEEYNEEFVETHTQKEIRQSVKDYLKEGQEELTDLDGDEEAEETDSNTPEDNTEVTAIDVTADYLEIKGTVNMVKAYLTEFTESDAEGICIDKDDIRLCKSLIANLGLLMSRVHNIIKDGGLSYTEYSPTEDKEVQFE
jgi:hypothetical protein